jgi:DUF1365 family protein
MHHRLAPREHRFVYHIFMFYIDLDELDLIHARLRLFSRNKFNWFSFQDKDHALFGTSAKSETVKTKITNYLKSQNIIGNPGKIMLLTNATVFGYTFNPISVYICYDQYNKPFCSVAEVCNTHGEMKLYLLDPGTLTDNVFTRRTTKHFYVSPFSNLDALFEFIFRVPGEDLNIRVDDYEDNKRFLLSALTGKKKKLTDARLLQYAVQFPMVTVKIIFLIYWQALVLWVKRVPYKKKDTDQHLQKDLVTLKSLNSIH